MAKNVQIIYGKIALSNLRDKFILMVHLIIQFHLNNFFNEISTFHQIFKVQKQ